MHEGALLAQEGVGVAHSTTQDATDDVACLGVGGQLPVGNGEGHGADVVGDDAHGDINGLSPSPSPVREGIFCSILQSCQLLNLLDRGLEHVGVVVGVLALQGAHEALEAHTGVDDIHAQGHQRAVGLALELHEHDVPDLDDLRVVLVHQLAAGHLGFLLGGTAVEMDLGAGTAGACVAHLPEVVVLVAVDDVVCRHVLGPERGSFVVAGDVLLGRALEDGDVEVLGVEADDIHEIFPCHVDGALLEVVAERPVAEHLEHRVVVGVVAYLFQVVVLTADAQTFLRVGAAARFGVFGAKDDILPLVHTSVGEHKCGVVLDDHGG